MSAPFERVMSKGWFLFRGCGWFPKESNYKNINISDPFRNLKRQVITNRISGIFRLYFGRYSLT
jgi:hypothetical protein